MKNYFVLVPSIVALALLSLTSSARAAITMVQVATSTNNNSGGAAHNMCNVQFASNVTAGDLIVVLNVSKIATSSVLGITDGTGDAFSFGSGASSTSGVGVDGEIWYAANSVGGIKSVTTTLTAQPTGEGFSCVVAEFSGVNAFDAQAATTTATFSGFLSSGSSTISFTPELIIGAGGTPNNVPSWTPGAGFSVAASSTNSRVLMEYATTTTAGLKSASASNANTGVAEFGMATFYELSSSPALIPKNEVIAMDW